jgi:hypothetical protein
MRTQEGSDPKANSPQDPNPNPQTIGTPGRHPCRVPDPLRAAGPRPDRRRLWDIIPAPTATGIFALSNKAYQGAGDHREPPTTSRRPPGR